MYKKAIKKTGDPRAYNNLAWLYCLKEMKLDEAEGLARKAVELSPDAQDFKDTLEKIIEKKTAIQVMIKSVPCTYMFIAGIRS